MNEGISTARIQLHLDVHQPIELVDLTLSFQALAFEYRKYLADRVRQSGGKPNDDDIKLFITKIENNCILAELGGAVAILGSLFSLMDYVNIFSDFVTHIGNAINYFRAIGESGKLDPREVRYTKAECGRFADLLDVVAKNTDGNLGIRAIEYKEDSPEYKVYLKAEFTSEEAYRARKGALIAQKALEYTGEADYKSVLMYFYQANTDEPKSFGKTGHKAVVKTVSDKALPVYFVSEMDQQRIAYSTTEPGFNPFKASYVVDVNVETDRNDVARLYRIIKVHEIISGDD